MDNEESPNAQLKQRITELRQLLEKKKRKLQTSLRHSERGSDSAAPHASKRVRFSEPAPDGSPLCSQNLFDDESDAALAAALSESDAVLNCDLDASPPRAAAPHSRLTAPCRFQPAACDLLLRGPDAFLCLMSAQRVQVFAGLANGAAPLNALWSRAAPRPTLLLACLLSEESNLLPDGPNLLLAEAIDDAVHILCLEFRDRRLHSAYPLCVLPRTPNLLSCSWPGGPTLLLATSPAAAAAHAALIGHEDSALRAVHRWERRFAIPCAAAVGPNRAVVLAQRRGKAQLGLLRLEDGCTEFFPSGEAQPRSVELLREEGPFCFLGGLESVGARSAAFLLCLCANTLQLRRLRTIPLTPASLPEGPAVSFWVETVLLWAESGALQAATLDWSEGTCVVKQAETRKAEGVVVLPKGGGRVLCICGPEAVTLFLPPVAAS